MYKKILVAVDGSDNSKRATEHATHIASLCGKLKVDLLYILDYDRTRTDIIHNIGRHDLHIDRKKRLIPIESVLEQKASHSILLLNTESPLPQSSTLPIKGNMI